MTERKRSQAAKAMGRKTMNPKDPMSRQQLAVTDWLKNHLPTKKTKFLHSHVVDYFPGNKAIDMLLQESPWAPLDGKAMLEERKEGELVFDSRDQAVEYLDTLLRFKMFHRAKKIPVTQKDKDEKIPLYKLESVRQKRMKRSEEEREEREEREKEKEESEKESEKESERSEKSESEKDEKAEKEGEKKEEKKKRKIRLDMHLEQVFVDSSDAYVWLYDPIPWYYWLLGGGICLIVILFCLFPLWPRKIRRASGWLSFASVCFMIGVVGLAAVKYLVFSILYLLSNRKLRFWLMPNLTKDVGFLASFWPLCDYTYTGEVIEMEEDELEAEAEVVACVGASEESDSAESSKSAFEIIEKSKDD